MHFEEFSFDDIDDNDLNNMLESGDVAKGTVPYQSFFNYIKAKIPDLYDDMVDELIHYCPRLKESENEIYYLNERRKRDNK